MKGLEYCRYRRVIKDRGGGDHLYLQPMAHELRRTQFNVVKLKAYRSRQYDATLVLKVIERGLKSYCVYDQTFVREKQNIFVLSDKGPTLETLDFTIHIGSTPTFLYFDLYLNTTYAAHYVYFTIAV